MNEPVVPNNQTEFPNGIIPIGTSQVVNNLGTPVRDTLSRFNAPPSVSSETSLPNRRQAKAGDIRPRQGNRRGGYGFYR